MFTLGIGDPITFCLVNMGGPTTIAPATTATVAGGGGGVVAGRRGRPPATFPATFPVDPKMCGILHTWSIESWLWVPLEQRRRQATSL